MSRGSGKAYYNEFDTNAAARAALKPTKEALQQSAVELVKRLCAVGRDEKAGAK